MIKIYILVLFISCFIINSCGKKEIATEDSSVLTEKTETTNTIKEDEPSQIEVENEVYYLIPKISYEDYHYNTCLFLNRDGVYKNLAITSIRINSREKVRSTEKGDGKEQLMNLHLNGIADKYNVVGFGGTSFVGRINFSIDKDFRFLKNKGKWLGYIYDDLRDRKTLRFKKDFLR